MKLLGAFFRKTSTLFSFDDYVEIYINDKCDTYYAHYKGDRYKVIENSNECIATREVTTSFLFEHFIGVEEEMKKQKRLIKLKKKI